MIITVIYICCICAVRPKNNSPVAANPNRPILPPVTEHSHTLQAIQILGDELFCGIDFRAPYPIEGILGRVPAVVFSDASHVASGASVFKPALFRST